MTNLTERQAAGWVPVSERLPEAGVRVLGTNDEGVVHIENRWTYGDEGGWDSGERVVAWMPLPEPYPVEGK